MKLSMRSHLVLILALLLGIGSGCAQLPFLSGAAELISTSFLSFLQLLSLPIIFFSVTATVSGLTDFSEMRSLGMRVIKYTVLTTVIAASVALGLYVLIEPATTIFSTQTGAPLEQNSSSYLSHVAQIIPSNVFTAFATNNVIGVAFMAFVLGIGTLFLPTENKKTLHHFFSSVFAVILKITSGAVKLMPLGIWAFTALFVQDLMKNSALAEGLGWYLAVVLGANLIQGLVVLPLILKWKGISPWKTAKGMFGALVIAFFSKSSNATLPTAIQCAETRLGVSRRVSQFSFPLCSVINMNGCAGFILSTVLFVAMSNGLTFTPWEMGGWVLLATLAAIGNAGVPMGCYFLTSAFLVGMGVPLYIMGLILPIYTLLDMVETSVNVWSDSCVAVLVDKEVAAEGLKPENRMVTAGEQK